MSLLLAPGRCSSTPVGTRPTADALPAANAPFSWSSFLSHAGATALLFGVILWAYHPSLYHVHRSDQWCFLLDNIDHDSFPAVLAHSYSYCRTRKIAQGDYPLFRPIMFAFLAAEKGLFGYNLVLWQAAGIGLHCLCVTLILRILLVVNRSFAEEALETDPARGFITERRMLTATAYGLSLFFGVNCVLVEMVIWNHINGYLLFAVFTLGALLLCVKILQAPDASFRRQVGLLGSAFLLLLLAAFTYEVGQFFAVVVGGVLAGAAFRHGRRRRAIAVFVLFVSILAGYQGVNLLDQVIHPGVCDASIKDIVERAWSLDTLEHAIRYVLFTVVQPWFPSGTTWMYIPERVHIVELNVAWENTARGAPFLLASLAVVAAGSVLSWRGLVRFWTRPGKPTFLIVFLPLSLIVLPAMVVVLGRMNLRPEPTILSGNSYYAYFPFLGVLTSLYVLWVSAASSAGRRPSTGVAALHTVFLLGLVALSVASACKLHEITATVKTIVRSDHRLIAGVKRFVDAHKAEPGFSFAFDPLCGNVKTLHGIAVPIVLFKRYINNIDPKYVLTTETGKLEVRSYRAAGEGEPRLPQLFPDLVLVGSFYNFYHFDGWFYGALARNGYFCPEQEDYPYLIVDRTLPRAVDQVRAKLAEEKADLKSGRSFSRGAVVTRIEAGFHGFDLFEAAGWIYAVPANEGPLERNQLLFGRYSRCYWDVTLAAVKREILEREPLRRGSRPPGKGSNKGL